MPSPESITREILGNVPAWLATVFYVCAFGACGFAAVTLFLRFRKYRQGRPESPGERAAPTFASGARSLFSYLAFHKQLLRDPYAGAAHLLVFYGFFILFGGTCLVFLEHDTPLHFFYGRFYLAASLVIDLGGVLFLIGLILFLYRRGAQKTVRILPDRRITVFLWLLLLIGLSGFLLEAARIARDMPEFECWSIVGYGLAWLLRAIGLDGDSAASFHRGLWATHAALCVAFFALAASRFFSHIFYSAATWSTRAERPIAQLRWPGLETRSPGAITWQDMPRTDLLQADGCTTCGRCNEVCPANAAGKPLQPREVVLGLRAAMSGHGEESAPRPRLSLHIPDQAVWSCTTCGACNHACPVGIEVYDKILEVRRGHVEAGIVPDAAVQVFESTEGQWNPFQKPHSERLAWASGLTVPLARESEPIELLYWVGCAGSFDPDGQTVSRSMIKILNHLGVNYRILGHREICTGDPARRMGEEGLFRDLASQTIQRFNSHQVHRVLTHCPHCFNTFKNEYPALGARFEVEHHSQFLARFIREGRLKIAADSTETVTFHDPCYLGRGNGETAAPRQVLRSLPSLQLVEMSRHGRDSFCCGAGGGSMWLDLKGRTRVENLRAREAAETKAGVLATACPFCKGMLEAGRQALGESGKGLRVRDLAELVVEAIEKGGETP